MPVRLQAGISLPKFLVDDTAKDLLKPALKDILLRYLSTMKEIDSEELVNALEMLVKIFKNDISPYAVELTHSLVESYQRLISSSYDDDDGESVLAAVGCVTAIRRILDSVHNNGPLMT